MIHVKLFRENLDYVYSELKRRGFELDKEKIIKLEKMRKEFQAETEKLQAKRNSISKSIGIAKSRGESAAELFKETAMTGKELNISKEKSDKIIAELNSIYSSVPNIPHKSVPNGLTEENNIEIKKHGEPRKFNFKPKDHVELGEISGEMDFELSAKITGSRFVVLKNNIARLHRSLMNFMMDLHIDQHGYQEVYVPHMVNRKSLYGTGQLPKFESDLFNFHDEFEYSLIPTAEVPVTNFVRDVILDEKDLPLKYVAHTPCYRSEAGSYGKDMRGMIRQHQFEKVELVQIVHPERSYERLEELRSHAEKVLQLLELPYRVVNLCGGDLGFSSAKTYDIEVWMPSQNRYREISSCSNFEDFQARRMNARFRSANRGKSQLVHTINGSGIAVGRALVALMENYQTEDGTIKVPSVLC